MLILPEYRSLSPETEKRRVRDSERKKKMTVRRREGGNDISAFALVLALCSFSMRSNTLGPYATPGGQRI